MFGLLAYVEFEEKAERNVPDFIEALKSEMPSGPNEKRRDFFLQIANLYLDHSDIPRARKALSQVVALDNQMHEDAAVDPTENADIENGNSKDVSPIPPAYIRAQPAEKKLWIIPCVLAVVRFIFATISKPTIEAIGKKWGAYLIAKTLVDPEIQAILLQGKLTPTSEDNLDQSKKRSTT